MKLVNPLKYAGMSAIITVFYLSVSSGLAGSFDKPKSMLFGAVLYSAFGVYLLRTFHKFKKDNVSKIDKMIFSVSSVFVFFGLIFDLYNVWIAFTLIF
ncbi:MAG TPA: hypothetical protein VK675_02075 [Candidatus Paceibacterota bacterium]|nr:hypothetical protein [Candidatus Paceibacterota bacterium]